MIFAPIAFVLLLVLGFITHELSWVQIGLFLFAAGSSLFVFYLLWLPLIAYTVVLGIMDVILILMIFKRDITIR